MCAISWLSALNCVKHQAPLSSKSLRSLHTFLATLVSDTIIKCFGGRDVRIINRIPMQRLIFHHFLTHCNGLTVVAHPRIQLAEMVSVLNVNIPPCPLFMYLYRACHLVLFLCQRVFTV